MINGEWRDTYIYGEQYQVSNTGFVRNKLTGNILKAQEDEKGYLRVRLSLHDKKRSARVHRLVAIAFIPNPENKPQVNHIDTNKKNNSVDNLEWNTNGENQIHAFKTGLNYVTGRAGRKKRALCKIDFATGKVIEEYVSLAEASERNALPKSNICKVLKGERATCGGYGWKYKD